MTMTMTRKIGYGIGGFTLSLFTAAAAALSLQAFFATVWMAPESLLVAYASALAISITALAATWLGLLQGLKNKAMIRGVWWQIYTVTAVGVVGLAATLFI